MSQYVVVTPEGNRFGPTDFQTLSKWAREGRVGPGMMVEDLLSGVTMSASGVPGLFGEDFEVDHSPGQQIQPDFANASFILGLVGLGAWCVPVAGLLVGVFAIVLGGRSLNSDGRTKAIVGVCLGAFCVLMHVGATILALVLLQG